jgi:hypothetical protein
VDADGGEPNSPFRKCSTVGPNGYVVHNATAPNYAYDDTNPTVLLSKQQNFLNTCASGATGDGYEYMAYRGGWRLMTAPGMKAYFGELYTTDLTVDDSYSLWATTVNGHTVSPMINIGPNQPMTIHDGALKMCNRVANNGYFGVYNGDWRNAMNSTDPRAVALSKALNECTGM